MFHIVEINNRGTILSLQNGCLLINDNMKHNIIPLNELSVVVISNPAVQISGENYLIKKKHYNMYCRTSEIMYFFVMLAI